MAVIDVSEVKPGAVFGRLTVLGKSTKAKGRWDCQCECGKVVDLTAKHLVTQRRSCGCGRTLNERPMPGYIDISNHWLKMKLAG